MPRGSARRCRCSWITKSRSVKGRSVRYRSATKSLSTRRLKFCSPTGAWSCSGSTSWRRKGRHPTAPSGGGPSGSSTRGTSEERTIVDNQQAGRITQKEHNDLLDVWREQVNQARGGQEASWSLALDLAQQSADAYEDFLESIFFYYGENARAAEKGTREG